VIYLVFAYCWRYPRGGAEDLKSKHTDLASATAAALKAYKKQFPGGRLPGPNSNWSLRDCEAHVLRVSGNRTRIVYRCGGVKVRIA